MQQQLDHIAARVTAACALGAAAGGITAMYKGELLGRTMARSSLSCGMVATACFSAERLASAFLATEGRGSLDCVKTHVVGGAVGGAVVGALYGNKPIQGALFLMPIFFMVGVGQELYDRVREERVHR